MPARRFINRAQLRIIGLSLEKILVKSYSTVADAVTLQSNPLSYLPRLVGLISFCAACNILPFSVNATTTEIVSSNTTLSSSPTEAFAGGSLDGWTERSFEGNTDYQLVTDAETNATVLQGHAKKQASILYREQSIDLLKTPVINWSWKVDRTFTDINEKAKNGDDFPARLYVVAQIGFLPWDTLAINYVWSSQLPVGDSWSNPFTDKARMVAVESGDANVGVWQTHSRNIAEDFKTLFNTDIEEIDGFAVMVDGDNSQQEAVAWFGEISFSSDAAVAESAL